MYRFSVLFTDFLSFKCKSFEVTWTLEIELEKIELSRSSIAKFPQTVVYILFSKDPNASTSF